MSSMMQPGMPVAGMPSAGMPQKPPMTQNPPGAGVQDKLKEQRSPFNPTDIAMMVQDGDITPQTTVEEFLGKLGVDVRGPITQLGDMFKKGMHNADPANKLRSIGGPAGAPPQAGMGGPPPQGAPPAVPPGGVDRLLAGQ